jgi:hypothetical protein
MTQSIVNPCRIVVCSVLIFQSLYPTVCFGQKHPTLSDFDIALSAGPEMEELTWSISGFANDATYLDVLSELHWHKLRTYKLSLGMRYYLKGKVVFAANLQKSFIHAGTVTDTDFQQPNRRDTVYHASYDSHEGSMFNTDVSAGYRFTLFKGFSITPFIGYIRAGENLMILQDNTSKNDLKSTYQTTWSGIKLGVEVETRISTKTKMVIRADYNQTRYSASADWNLVEAFQHPVSFTHHANGFGLIPQLAVMYSVTPYLDIVLGGHVSYWRTGKGTDTVYLQHGQPLTTELNKVRRATKGVSIGVSVRVSKIGRGTVDR